MSVVDLGELSGLLPPRACLLGLDVGEKRIGLAISDVGRVVATPIRTLTRRRMAADSEALRAAVVEFEAAGLVVGLPVEMDGREGRRCQSVRQFVRNITPVVDLPTLFWDERLSTAGVERMLIGEADLGRARRREVVDRAAAAWILQGALDALRRVVPRGDAGD